MIDKLKYIRREWGKQLLYEDIMFCFYCKHWNIVNYCNLKNKKRYYDSTCNDWEVLEL